MSENREYDKENVSKVALLCSVFSIGMFSFLLMNGVTIYAKLFAFFSIGFGAIGIASRN